MGPELIAAIAGPIAGCVFGIFGFVSRRSMMTTDNQLKSIAAHVEQISVTVTQLQIQLPTNYATKEELSTHIKACNARHNDFIREVRDLKDEVVVMRAYLSNYRR